MKRKLIVAMLTTAMVASLAGCGSSSASTSADTKDSAESTEAADTADESGDTAAAGTGKIGISMPTQSLERWNRDGAYLDEQFKQAVFK